MFFEVFIKINMPSGQCSEILGGKVSGWAFLKTTDLVSREAEL